jgi:hypothetical protein
MPRGGEGDIVILGAEQLAAVTRRLKAAGSQGKGLRKELLQRIRIAAKPLVEDVRNSAMDTLPNAGGLNRRVRTGIGIRTRAAGNSVGVRVVAKNRYAIKGMDQGRLRHPVFGNRDNWVKQSVPPGWFTRPVEAGADEARKGALDAIDHIARKVEGH